MTTATAKSTAMGRANGARLRARRVGMLVAALGALGALGGCAVYSPQPLPRHDDLAAHLTAQQPAPLDMNAVATLAVLNNPDLRTARAKLGVAAAQAFAAGILPDPQFNYSADHPTDRVGPTDYRAPLFNAYGYGLSVDLQALLTYRSRRSAAHAAFRQARAYLLWEEWQTVAQARTLFVMQSIADERRAFLAPATRVYAAAAARSARALAEQNITLDQAGADLDLETAVATQLGVAERGALLAAAGLHTLLGIRPDVSVTLATLGAPVVPTRSTVRAALARLPRTRPDLRALQAGYRSEEAQLRVAVLSQFPNIVVGFARARDTSNVHTTGFTVALTLPIFDRGRGNIAIQRATRTQLRADYLARLDQATGAGWQLWREMRELDAENRALDGRLPQLRASALAAERAFRAGNFPVGSYLAAVSAYLGARGTHLDLLQNLWADSIAFAAITGSQVQPVYKAS